MAVHSLTFVSGKWQRWGSGGSGEWGCVWSDLQRCLKRCMDNIGRWWRRWRRSDPRQRALRHPPSFPPFPHPQSLRRPCLRGRRGSSTIANGSAAEWWRGVMKPITTPINLTPRDNLKWVNACKSWYARVVASVRGHREGGSGASSRMAQKDSSKATHYFPRLLITSVYKDKANLVLEQVLSRKFSQSHSLCDALVYRHSLPVGSTPSHSLSLLPSLLCSVFVSIALSFAATWQIRSPLTSHHSARAPVSFPPKIKNI